MAEDKRVRVARRVAQELTSGSVVNLGIGLPTLVANYLPPEVSIVLHSENGFLGIGAEPEAGMEDQDLINAGGKPASILPNGSCFDSAVSFGIIRGGHIDTTVLGALEVDEQGNLANWMVPGKKITGMGGAMDLVIGAKKVIIAMEHVNKDGSAKIVRECTMPLTAKGEVDLIITDMAVIAVRSDGLHLLEIAENTTVDQVILATDASLILPENPLLTYF